MALWCNNVKQYIILIEVVQWKRQDSHAVRPEEAPTTQGVEDDVIDDVLKNFIKRRNKKGIDCKYFEGNLLI
jgi:hypothetical protein